MKSRRLLVLLVACLLSLILGELLLRCVYDHLPSLAGLDKTRFEVRPTENLPDTTSFEPWDSPLCRSQGLMGEREGIEASARNLEKPEAALDLLVLGDSIARGMGALPRHGVAWRVAAGLEERGGRPVMLANAALSGSGVCEQVLAGHLALQSHRPDLLLWLPFADDLSYRDSLLVEGRLVLFPEASRVPGVRSSYLLNAAWYAGRRIQEGRRERPMALMAGSLYRELVTGLLKRASGLDVPVLIVLIAPVGQPDCTPNSPEGSSCAMILEQERLMASELAALGVPFLDLSTFWSEHPGRALAKEREASINGGIAIHPDHEGHRLLSLAIVPVIEALLASDEPH